MKLSNDTAKDGSHFELTKDNPIFQLGSILGVLWNMSNTKLFHPMIWWWTSVNTPSKFDQILVFKKCNWWYITYAKYRIFLHFTDDENALRQNNRVGAFTMKSIAHSSNILPWQKTYFLNWWHLISAETNLKTLEHIVILLLLNKVWWQCLVPTSTTRFASDVGYRMAKI